MTPLLWTVYFGGMLLFAIADRTRWTAGVATVGISLMVAVIIAANL